MQSVLPESVRQRLRDRFVAGVADAEALFALHQADEDSLTGALGQSLSTLEPVVIPTLLGAYEVRISYRKLRGRGPGAPEKRFGADGIFQLAVVGSAGESLLIKGLPFQSKVEWRRKDPALLAQASLMEKHFQGGLVIDYTPLGYKACSSKAVVGARGSRTLVERVAPLESLGQVLGGKFLDCKLGVRGLYFDPQQSEFAVAPDLFPGVHVISTDLRAIG